MCSVSVVFDQYQPFIPQPSQWPQTPLLPLPYGQTGPRQRAFPTTEELRELLDSFHRAVEAAKTFDRLTGQPDCEDPEKAKLLDRVRELERRMDGIDAATA